MDTKIVTVVNQKGGVGKSTTALALAAGLAQKKGQRVLAIDLDAQANFSFTLGASIEGPTPTVLGVLTGEVPTQQAIQFATGPCDVIPAGRTLAAAEALINDTGKEYRLKEAIDATLLTHYDFIIIDTPPSLGILTINALTACTSVIIPAQADIYSIHGIRQLVDTIEPVKKYCNSALSIDGILLTRYNPRGVLSRDVAAKTNQLAESVGTRVYNAKIREAIVVKEAQFYRKSIFDYAPQAKVTADYAAFIDEFLNI